VKKTTFSSQESAERVAESHLSSAFDSRCSTIPTPRFMTCPQPGYVTSSWRNAVCIQCRVMPHSCGTQTTCVIVVLKSVQWSFQLFAGFHYRFFIL